MKQGCDKNNTNPHSSLLLGFYFASSQRESDLDFIMYFFFSLLRSILLCNQRDSAIGATSERVFKFPNCALVFFFFFLFCFVFPYYQVHRKRAPLHQCSAMQGWILGNPPTNRPREELKIFYFNFNALFDVFVLCY